MKKLIFILVTNCFLILNASSSDISCKLQRGESLTIGCSADCGWRIEKALKRYASKAGFKLNIVNMAERNINTDYSNLDGIIIPGGEDIDPVHYKNVVEEDLRRKIEELDHLVDYTDSGPIRDQFELEMLANYFNKTENKSLPLLGICRGMQILTVSQRIPLFIDINAELGIPNRRDRNDKIFVSEDDSLISELMTTKPFLAYKNHHQGLRVPYFKKYQAQRWPQISITAYSNNNLIAEAIEFKDRPILGVQFHPESDRGILRKKIFSWILDRSCRHKNKKTKLE